MSGIDYEMVDEIPERMKPASQYDPVADMVRKTGRVAKITSSEGSLHTLANRLRTRYEDLDVKARTTGGGHFVFIGPMTEEELKARDKARDKTRTEKEKK